MALSGPVARLRNHQLDLRDMLLVAGVGEFNAVMSIPYMNFLPMTTEPYAQGVLQIIQGLQRLLIQRGARITIDGGLGPKTAAALALYAGPRWRDRSWAQLYGDVIAGKKWSGRIRNDRSATSDAAARARGAIRRGALAGDRWDYSQPQLGGDPITDLITNPFVLAAGGFFVWWKYFRKPSRGGGGPKLLTAGNLEDL